MQNAPVDTHESANITNLENVATLNAATSNIGEEYLEKVSTAEAGERPAAVMKLVPDVVVDCASVQIAAREKEVIPTVVHEDPPLDRVSTLRQMDVDETREGIGKEIRGWIPEILSFHVPRVFVRKKYVAFAFAGPELQVLLSFV